MAVFNLDDEDGNPKPQSAVNSDVADLASDIIENAPGVSEHVISQNANSESGAESGTSGGMASTGSGDSDAAGEKFDPAKHATGTDGKGVKTAKGIWRKKRGSNSRVVTPSRSGGTTTVEQSRAEVEAKGRMAGQVAANSVFFACSTLLGAEWQPIKTIQKIPAGEGKEISVEFDERAEHEKIWGDWFVATGRTDFPPGVALSLALISYAGKRFTMPETQKKTQSIKEWFAHRWVSWKMKRAKAKDDARSNTRSDSQRKDDASQATSANVSRER